MSDPREPTGSNNASDWTQKVHGKVFGPRGRIRNTTTIKADYRHDGIFLHAKIPPQSVTQASVQIKVLRFKQSFGDYFLCTDGTSVAKPPKLRNSLAGETIYGTSVAYSYPHNVANDALAYLYRTASVAGVGSENQGVTPQYLVNDTIYAIQATTNVVSSSADTSQPVGTAITWLDLNIDGRAWTRFANQSF